MDGHVRLGVFSPSVVLGVAEACGALAEAGLHVEEIPVTSSSQQFALLLAGGLDAVFTSPDNVLAYRGSAANPLGRTADVRILAAVDRGLGLSLFHGPRLSRLSGLRGGVLGVDVPTSGFAFVAYELLARHGLRYGADYEVRPLGTTPMRATALIEGQCDMTVLNAGSDLRAEAAGCTRLSRASSLGPCLGTVLAAPAEGTAALGALTGVLLKTARSLVEGRLAELAASVIRARLGLDPEDALRHLQIMADRDEGLVPGGRVDPGSLGTLRWLRSRYGGGQGAEPDPGLVDDRFLPPAGL